MRRALLVLALAGCAGSADGGVDIPDAGGQGDALPACVLAYDPVDPVANPILPIRVYSSVVHTPGVISYLWRVTFNGTDVPFTEQAADFSQIGFIAETPGVYRVEAQFTGAATCTYADINITVGAPGANTSIFRLRTMPPASLAPPQETLIQVKGGGDADRAITLDAGLAVTGTVRNMTNNAGVQAYLKFIPVSAPNAYSEVFSSMTGAYSLRLLLVNHDVLVVPAVAGLAPRLVPWSSAPLTETLLVGPGTAVNGTVRNPAGVGFGGAKVQLYAGGVPSTIATTAADGSFTVRTDFPASATNVTVKVTPPAASGLPRLEATGTFSLASALQINYSAALATCDLANTFVRRGGTAQPGARVSVVGALAGTAGTVTAGITVNATNTVRVTATADGNGRLPAMLVPRGALSAVTELAGSDHAISALDTTSSCSVAQVDAPAQTTINGTTRDGTTAIGGVRIEAMPAGMLALAGALPVQAISQESGAFSLPLAPGARYHVRFSDPLARVAPLEAKDVAPGGVPTNAVLPEALAISGLVSVASNTNPVIGASIQILCATCTGLEATLPIAETATDIVSRYRIAVPDPGTM